MSQAKFSPNFGQRTYRGLTSTRFAQRWWVAMGALGLLIVSACASEVGGTAIAEPGAVPTSKTISSPTSATPSKSSSSSGSTSATAGTTQTTTSNSPTSEPTTESSDPQSSASDDGSGLPPEGSEGQTPPGAVLKLTDPATLRIEYFDTGIFTFTGFSIVQGTAEDWVKYGVDPATTVGLLPWVVRVTVKQEAGPLTFQYSSVESDIRIITDQGRELNYSTAYGSDDCKGDYYTDAYVLGDSYTTCTIYEGDDRAKVVKLEWNGSYDGPYYDNPVTWTVA
ncbi:hypothetical protein EH165_03605 [Nakamurella antarctica]|uniref:Uncharacterized protein n=1 Tax=Nakamurella antarctica TaxID=1902245 RepID=A0A3G8ZUH6_9ACTN|nr:hypothetical protein [Nakamurella antarctica]AZI57381.1 hypothetical protein EH165_03605 [Nakamurella antarctica]